MSYFMRLYATTDLLLCSLIDTLIFNSTIVLKFINGKWFTERASDRFQSYNWGLIENADNVNKRKLTRSTNWFRYLSGIMKIHTVPSFEVVPEITLKTYSCKRMEVRPTIGSRLRASYPRLRSNKRCYPDIQDCKKKTMLEETMGQELVVKWPKVNDNWLLAFMSAVSLSCLVISWFMK